MKKLFDKYINNIGTSWTNKVDVLKKVKKNGLNLQYADSGLRDDIDVVKSALEQNPESLQFASRHLRNNKDIALLAIELGSSKHISIDLTHDYQFAKEAWELTKHSYQKIGTLPHNILPPLYGEEYVWLELAENLGEITFKHFANMSKELCTNKNFMKKIIKKQSLCFQYASDELKDDDEIAELAVRGWANQLAYASHRIRNMKKFQKLFLKDQIKKIGKESANKNLNKIILDEDLHRG